MISITNNDNYLAEVVRLDKFIKHPNADRLRVWNIHGYEVITDMSREPGDVCVFFQIETQINNEILKRLNMYSDKELNEDKTQVGYVNSQGRVKAVKLRGIVSEGMLLPADKVLFAFAGYDKNDLPYDWEQSIGQKFDTIEGRVMCNKYVPIQQSKSTEGKTREAKVKINEFLIPGQFNLHYSTSKLQDNAWRFQDSEDQIVITDKWHGTSAVFSNVLTKRKLSFWEHVKKFFGSNIPTTEYSPMYSSRTVIKSIQGKYNVPGIGGYYNSDIWGKVFEDLKPVLFEGYTLYGEIVGYTGDKMIQKGYHYGCKPGEHKFLVYRITETSKNGIIEEYSWEDIKDFCKEHNLQHVPELFYGTIKDWMFKYADDGETLLDALKGVFLEKTCSHNINKVPSEGICIRNESGNKIAYKLKSKLFLEKESKDLDTALEVIE